LPDDAAKLMVDALHVAVQNDYLAGVERYLNRALRRSDLSATVISASPLLAITTA
jgi:hypothetical protein